MVKLRNILQMNNQKGKYTTKMKAQEKMESHNAEVTLQLNIRILAMGMLTLLPFERLQPRSQRDCVMVNLRASVKKVIVMGEWSLQGSDANKRENFTLRHF